MPSRRWPGQGSGVSSADSKPRRCLVVDEGPKRSSAVKAAAFERPVLAMATAPSVGVMAAGIAARGVAALRWLGRAIDVGVVAHPIRSLGAMGPSDQIARRDGPIAPSDLRLAICA